MRIPDIMTQCVIYLCVKYTKGEHAGQYRPIGTAFFVSVQVEDFEFLYLVTAKHNITKIGEKFETFYLRMNDKKTGIIYIPVERKKAGWLSFDNMPIDLAILPIGGIDRERFDHMAVPLSMFATDAVLLSQFIGLGDEVFALGLFTGRAGKGRNIPIMRTGIIASMPEEPIMDGDQEYYAFLVELRSIGGISGSPVFVYLDRGRDATTSLPHNNNSVCYLLGTIRGKWTLDKKLIKEQEEIDVDLAYNKGESLNMGIAIVTPAEQLWHLVMDKELAESRQNYVNSKRTIERIEEDSDIDDDGSEVESEFTEPDFFQALEKTSRTVAEDRDKSD